MIPLRASESANAKVAELGERLRPFLLELGRTRLVEPEPAEDYVEALNCPNNA